MDIYTLLLLMHLVGLGIGVGGATISDILFFRTIRDDVVSKDELATLHLMTYIVLTGFFLLFISGIGFVAYYYINSGTLANVPPKVWAKLTIVAIIFINSQILHHKVMPLIRNSIGQSVGDILEKKSPLVLTSGAISMTSWYAALLLGSLRGLQTPYATIMALYLVAVLSAIIVGNIVGFKRLRKIYSRRKTEASNIPPKQTTQ